MRFGGKDRTLNLHTQELTLHLLAYRGGGNIIHSVAPFACITLRVMPVPRMLNPRDIRQCMFGAVRGGREGAEHARSHIAAS